jgi:glycosylphosphatidylinositol transamidase (GPIT) subunit GPI8
MLIIVSTVQQHTHILHDKRMVLSDARQNPTDQSFLSVADNLLGLAVIERWTFFLLTDYKERVEMNNITTTTLHDIMVAPFASTSSSSTTVNFFLAAQVGINDDTSNRKFQDVLLSEFFGEQRNTAENVVHVIAQERTTTNKRLLIDVLPTSTTDDNPYLEWMKMGLLANEARGNSYSNNRDWDYSMDAKSKLMIIPGVSLLLLALGLTTAAEKMLRCR